jgi:hypothetical protein
MPADVDKNRKQTFPNNAPVRTISAEGEQTIDPFSMFFAARDMSYEELTARRKVQQELMRKEAEETTALMSDAMRRANIDSLISVANYEITGMSGISPDQAVVVLYETIFRPEYKGVMEHFPGLKEAVERRYAELQNRLLPDPRKA